MAYTSTFQSYMPAMAESEEERRRRLEQEAAAAGPIAPTPVKQTITTDPVTGEQRMKIEGSVNDLSANNPLTPTVFNPGDAVAQQPAPVMPEAPAPVEQEQQPMPQNVQMVDGKLKLAPLQIGEGVDLAGPMVAGAVPQPAAPAPVAPASNADTLRAAQSAAAGNMQMPAPQPQPAPMTSQNARDDLLAQQTPTFESQFAEAADNDAKLAGFYNNPNLNPEQKRVVGIALRDTLTKQQGEAKGKEELAAMSENDIARLLKSKSEEGSWAKMLLLGFISPELAGKEAAKLGLNDKWEVGSSAEGKPILYKSRDGIPMEGYDSSTGRRMNAKDLLGAIGSAPGKLKPDVSMQDVEKDGMAGRVATLYDKNNRPRTVVLVGNQEYPYDSSWKSRDISKSATKDTFRTTLDLAKQFGSNVLDAEKQYEIDAGPFGSASNPMTREDFRRQYNFSLNQVPGVSTGTTAAPVAEAPAAAAPAAPPVTNAQPQPQAKPAPVKPEPIAQTNRPVGGGGGGGVSLGAAPKRQNYSSETDFKIAKERYDGQQKLNNQIAADTAAAEIQRKKEMRLAEEKPGAAAKGEQAATDVKNQGFADRTYGLMQQIDKEIRKSTGSSIGAGADTVAAAIGSSTEGSKAIARLNVLSYGILSNIPRFEGPQSDIDVQMYKQAAGDFNNRTLPIEDRLAALGALNTILQRYDKAGKNDWSYGTAGSKSKVRSEADKIIGK